MDRMILIIVFALMLSGCGSCGTIVTQTETIDTVMREIRIDVPVPEIEDTLDAIADEDFIRADRVIVREDGVADTVIQVRYYPVEEKVYVRVKPDTVQITRVDTITVTHQKTEITRPPGFWENNFWYLFLVLVLILAILIFIRR